MSHPDIDPESVSDLRSRLGAEADGPIPDAEHGSDHGSDHVGADVEAGGAPAPAGGRADPTRPVPSASPTVAGATPAEWKQRAKERTRVILAPVVARARAELARAAATEQDDLRREVDQLREELARVRTEHAAELAALHEQLEPDSD